MPELPEVETTKEGIKTHLEGQQICGVIVRNSRLRLPVPADIEKYSTGKIILTVTRRAKYILIQLSSGYLLIHLGMSGHLRIVPQEAAAEKHAHVDILLNNGSSLRYCDPRRFGMILYLDDNPYEHALLSHLGPEPLSDAFSADYLYKKTRNKNKPTKSLIMTNEVVVGVGNIYATESLYQIRIHPQTPAKQLTEAQCQQLCSEIKRILHFAIKAGGTTLRDFYAFDGKPGYFSISLQVYGRKKQPCFQCMTPIETLVIAGRHSAFCPKCQPAMRAK